MPGAKVEAEPIRVLSRVVERDYSRVPSVGDTVFLDDEHETLPLLVSRVIWLEGGAMVEFDLEAESFDDIGPDLEARGFENGRYVRLEDGRVLAEKP
ncbi:MAG: hypothetical protein WEB06_10550 [Actinomycetota bacterium]